MGGQTLDGDNSSLTWSLRENKNHLPLTLTSPRTPPNTHAHGRGQNAQRSLLTETWKSYSVYFASEIGKRHYSLSLS